MIKSIGQKYPQLKEIYSPNNEIEFDDLRAAHRSRSLLWICDKCGLEYSRSFRYMKDHIENLDETCTNCNVNSSRIAEGESFAEVHPELLKEYDDSNTINPYSVKPLSKKEVLWNCPNGHQWKAAFFQRHRGQNCTVCTDSTSLHKLFIDIYKSFSPNNDANPEKIQADATTKYLWICPDCGNEFVARVCDMTSGKAECPFCNGKNLSVVYPESKDYWDSEKNKSALEKVQFDKTTPYYWKCLKGHEYIMPVSTFVKHRQNDEEPCPYCAGRRTAEEESFFALYPDLLKYWNEDYLPNNIKPSSQRTYNWKCSEGHEFKIKLKTLVEYYLGGEEPCPYCAGRMVNACENSFKALHPELAEYWDYDKNERSSSPERIFERSQRKYWWKCEQGHSFSKSANEMIIMNNKGIELCPVCRGRFCLSGFNSLAETHPELEQYWDKDNERNFDECMANHALKTRWHCPDCNNILVLPVRDFVNNDYDCPYCEDKKALVGYNSLRDTHPELEQYWKDTERNFTDFTERHSYTAEWECPECGGIIRVSIKDFINGNYDCPYCVGRKILDGFNSLKDTNPELEQYWSENNERDYNQVMASMFYVARWNCPDCGGEYGESVRKFVSGERDCPYCNDRLTLDGFNSLRDTNPELEKYWLKTNEKDYNQVRASMAYIARWICPDCGGEYCESVNEFINGKRDCPYCNDRRILPGYNSFKVKYPELMKEWDEISNYVLTDPDKVSGASTEIVWWECPNGHHYKMSIDRRVLFDYRGLTACPQCKGLNRKKSHFIRRRI